MTVRSPAVAGMFYPEDALELKEMINGFLVKVPANKVKGKIHGIIVPHAGYQYSGQVAAYAYKALAGQKADFKKVVLLGPSHFAYADKAQSDMHEHWQTPLGEVDVLRGGFPESETAHFKEHCLEVQVPFLQTVLGEFKLLPLVMGDAEVDKTAALVMKELDEKTLLVISTDLSHYHAYDEAVAKDKKTTAAILALDYEKTAKVGDACGILPVLTAIVIAKKKKWGCKMLCYENSGDVTHDKSGVVGYASFILTSDP
jgi:MEMO1 family protein